ncbi:MAG: hypothetical protein GY950_07400, partial [bacterium]|nr:hypothetical protein [bacterium]
MKVYLSSSQDFNQMLVTSVFVHFLIFTFVLFLPKMTEDPPVIIPSFKMEIVEIVSPGRKRNKPTKVREREVAPKKKNVPSEPAKTEPVKMEAPAKIETPSPVLQELEKLSNPAKNPAILQELDQIAKLAPDVPERPVPQDKSSVFDQSLKNLNDLKNQKVPLPDESLMEKRSPVLEELESLQ